MRRVSSEIFDPRRDDFSGHEIAAAYVVCGNLDDHEPSERHCLDHVGEGP